MRYLITILFIAVAIPVLAQTKPDSIFNKVDLTIKEKTAWIDSIELKRKKAFNKIQSLPSATINQITDSLRNKGESILNSTNNATHQVDNTQEKINQAAGKMDGLENRATSKVDSINSRMNEAIDLDKISSSQISQPKVIDDTQQKLNTVTGSVNEKLNQLSSEAGGQGNMPASIQGPALPNTNLNLPDKLPVQTPDLGVSTPNINQLSIDKSNLQAPGIRNPIDDLKSPGNNNINIDRVTDLENETDKLSNISRKTSTYSKEISKVRTDGMEKAKTIKQDAIAKAPVKNELVELQKQDLAMKESMQQIENYGDPEEYRRKTLERAKKMVKAQLATQQTGIQEATAKLNAYQSKAGAIIGKKNELPKKRDDWRRLKKRERIVPGLTIQIQKPGGWLVDLNPSMRYRLTVYWSIGAGWNHRIRIGDIPKGGGLTNVFGPRAFSEVVLFKGFSFRVDSEMMNARIPSTTSDSYTVIRLWNHQVGIKKDFSFVPKVTGNVQFMYNYYSTGDVRTYPTKFNVRFGFEIPMKKKKHKVNQID